MHGVFNIKVFIRFVFKSHIGDAPFLIYTTLVLLGLTLLRNKMC
jgi:hypothetical protein